MKRIVMAGTYCLRWAFGLMFLLIGAAPASAQKVVAEFNPATSILVLPSVDLGSTRYSSVSVRLDKYALVALADVSAASLSVPEYDAASRRLRLPLVAAGTAGTHTGVVVTLDAMEVLSVGSSSPKPSGVFTLTSGQFVEGGVIPKAQACTSLGGSNQSPALTWSNPPAGANGYALIMDDEVSPCGTGAAACIHWNLFNLPASTQGVAAGAAVQSLAGVATGTTYSGEAGYQGPCPPSSHIYKTTVYALKTLLPLAGTVTGLTRSQFEANYGSEILGHATLTGSFSP